MRPNVRSRLVILTVLLLECRLRVRSVRLGDPRSGLGQAGCQVLLPRVNGMGIIYSSSVVLPSKLYTVSSMYLRLLHRQSISQPIHEHLSHGTPSHRLTPWLFHPLRFGVVLL